MAQRWDRADDLLAFASAGMAMVPLGFAWYLVEQYPSVARQPAVLFGFILLAGAGLLALAARRASVSWVQMIGGGGISHAGNLDCEYLTSALLYWALGMYLLFAGLHAVFPIVLKRRQPDAFSTGWWQAFPLVALVLVLVPVFRLRK